MNALPSPCPCPITDRTMSAPSLATVKQPRSLRLSALFGVCSIPGQTASRSCHKEGNYPGEVFITNLEKRGLHV